MKKKNNECRGSLDIDTLDNLMAIADDILDARNLSIILSKCFNDLDDSTIRDGCETLNQVIYVKLLDLSCELKDIIDEIEVKTEKN